ncbi:MAG: SDR family oxidoreductase [Desulfatirhabdiaceae bacterium]
MTEKPVLVAGATGYVGGRLIPLLLRNGYRVRAMARSLDKLDCRSWAGHSRVELVQADMMDLNSLKLAATGCFSAFYLVHSMNAKGHRFAEADRISAKNMVSAAEHGGLARIIYLGGLGETNSGTLSVHLRSRHEVGQILQSGAVPCTELRAAMILGSGSASFEILRYLAERLPVMITPKWVSTPCQPSAIGNVLNYLAGCLDCPETTGKILDIGGPDILTYRDIIQIYAEEAHLSKRWIIPVPLFTPRLSAYWIHLITPVPASIAIPLAEGLGVPVVCRNNDIQNLIPQKLISCQESIRIALQDILQNQVDSCWFDAGMNRPPEWAHCGDAGYAGGTILECGFQIRLKANPEDIWQAVSRIGGTEGWYFGNDLWKIRGLLDRLAGGMGLRRGRKDPVRLNVGDPLDFWRILTVDAPNRLILQAEMKMPGEAVLDIRIEPDGTGITRLDFLSRFLPRGLPGLIYWYVLYPFHEWIFKGMLIAIARKSQKAIATPPGRFTPVLTCRIK